MTLMSNRTALVGPMLVVLGLVNGCTLVGAGVGAAVDSAIPGPYERRSPLEAVRVKPRDRIELWLGNGQHIEGRYLGSFGPSSRDPEIYLIIEGSTQPTFVRSSDLSGLGVEVTGKGWLYGGLAGLAVDASLVIVAVIAANNLDYGHYSLSDSGCFC
jgi:hypothetical protein